MPRVETFNNNLQSPDASFTLKFGEKNLTPLMGFSAIQ